MAWKDLEKRREWFKNRYRENVLFLREYKLQKGCADCGWSEHHAGLEFDHLGDKKSTVSSKQGSSRKSIMREVEKCEVVCSRCHSIRTWERGTNRGDWRVEDI